MAVTSPEDVRDARGDDAGRSLPATPPPDSPYGARPERSVEGSAARIALIYLIVALAWVIFSDRIVGALVASHSLLTRVQTFKGSAFVSGSALLIYLLLRRELRNRDPWQHSARGNLLKEACRHERRGRNSGSPVLVPAPLMPASPTRRWPLPPSRSRRDP